MRRPHTEAEFDLVFVRDLKRRMKVVLKKLEQVEKWLKKADAFERGARVPTQKENEATEEFYRGMNLRRPR